MGSMLQRIQGDRSPANIKLPHQDAGEIVIHYDRGGPQAVYADDDTRDVICSSPNTSGAIPVSDDECIREPIPDDFVGELQSIRGSQRYPERP